MSLVYSSKYVCTLSIGFDRFSVLLNTQMQENFANDN